MSSISKHNIFSSRRSKRWTLLIPFALLTILLVVIPMAMVIIKSFLPSADGTVRDNWSIIDGFIINKIISSLVIAVISTVACIVIAYPFAYFLAMSRGAVFKTLSIFIATAPIWTSFLVKLIGLKTFFDLMYGMNNATYGSIYTIIGLIYLYFPFMLMPLYSVLNDMPKNYIYASHDLGCGGLKTFWKIILPYSKTALASGIVLVFLPALTTVAVPQFLDNSNDNSMIGDIIVQQGEQGLTSDIALARASTLSLVLSLVILGGYGVFIVCSKVSSRIYRRIRERHV